MDKKVLGISLDGVLRDMHSQFDTIYRKFFINNESLVKADDNFNYLLAEQQDTDLDAVQRLAQEKINLPVNTYDLRNHYHFESQEEFDAFLQAYAFEIFGMASQFPRSFEAANRFQNFGKITGLYETVLLVKGTEKIVQATYHFLGKSGCQLENIKHVATDEDKWSYCDVLIDDSPTSFENKPEGKTSIKITKPYNKYSQADHQFNQIGAAFGEMFLVQLFDPEKYKEILARQEKKQ